MINGLGSCRENTGSTGTEPPLLQFAAMPDNKSNEIFKEAGKVAWAVSGIYIFYIAFGVAQERINGGVYATELDEEGELKEERFTYPMFLIFTQCGMLIMPCATFQPR